MGPDIITPLKVLKIPKIKLSKSNSLSIIILLSLLFFLSFIFPTSQMLYWTIKFPKYFQDLDIISLNINTLYLVFLSSLFLIIFSFITNFGSRVSKSKILNYLNFISVSGYALPGVILAVAFITFFSWFSETIEVFLPIENTKKMFIGSIFGLVMAYFIRFYSLSFNGIRSNYLKINKSIDESSYLLGFSKIKTFIKIHLPYLKNSFF